MGRHQPGDDPGRPPGAGGGPLSRRLEALAAVAACAVTWSLMRWVIWPTFQLGDLRVYSHAARLIDAGLVPYRDFDLEYPPAAAGLFWAASRLPGGFQLSFSMLMLACLAITALGGLAAAWRLGLGGARRALLVGVIALSPVLLGPLVETRYDLVLSATVAWCVWAILSERWWAAWALLALAAAAKLVPIALLPALLVLHGRRAGWRPAALGAAASVAVVAATILPFAVIAPSGTWRLFAYHLDRPLQIESSGAALLLAWSHATGDHLRQVQSFGSENIAGSAPNAVATILSLLAVVLVVAIAWSLWRQALDPAWRDATVRALAATMAALVVSGKVLSPQYLCWLLPLVLLIPGRRGLAAAIVTGISLGVTQAIFPTLYGALVDDFDVLPVGLLCLRDAMLVAVLVLVWPRWGRPAERRALVRQSA
ncbi:MAG TPA: glycosyltransferase 87 family protein [Miltoncostaeaceae bacterium]|nr:glycosyltransferase 87 family protein [Miltoncostaeaceae bacterium]